MEKKNTLQLTEALLKLVNEKQLRKKLGANAKRRVISDFDSKKYGDLLVLEYEYLLKKYKKG